jgi:hypothetical protein
MKKTVVLALAAIMVLGVAGAAFADVSSVYVGAGGPPLTVSNTTPVTVSATVNPRLTLTITTPDAGQTVDFGAVNPGTTIPAETVSLAVKSNKVWTASTSITDAAPLNLTTTTLSTLPNYGLKGEYNFTDTYNIAPAFTLDPGAYTATVTYTVTQ